MLRSLLRFFGMHLKPAAADCDVWRRYARQVQQIIALRLAAGDDVALRLRGGLQSRAKGTVCTLTIAISVDERGVVAKSILVPFANQQATRDLKQLLQTLRFTPGEPNRMLLPVRINLNEFEFRDVSGIERGSA